jgi:hypothetical protein
VRWPDSRLSGSGTRRPDASLSWRSTWPFDDTRAEDTVFFAILAVVMVGIAAVARLVTRKVVRHRREGAARLVR